MGFPRAFGAIQTEDQWLRCSHENTALEQGVVQLAFVDDTAAPSQGSAPPAAAGLAFDSYCRLYHSIPAEGRVERVLWASQDAPAPLDLFEPPDSPRLGDFHAGGAQPKPLTDPRGLAVDDNGRLFVAQTEAHSILIFDLWSKRLLRRVATAGHPSDLAIAGAKVLAVLQQPAGLIALDARTGPTVQALPPGVTQPARVAVSPDDGQVFILDSAGTAQAKAVSATTTIAVPFATDIEFLPGKVLVAARLPGEDFLRFAVGAGSVEAMPPLKARAYDGLGIMRTPDNRILFWTALGFRHAVPARTRYVPQGRVIGLRLDSGDFRTQWGRLFLDACIPKDTDVRVACFAADEVQDDEPQYPRKLPVNVSTAVILRPDLSPPMPPESQVPAQAVQLLYRRDTGRELPFAPEAPNDPFVTYEAPIAAPPGRYLWVVLELSGNTRFSPRVRSLRAEYPSHDYMRRLPKTYSRQAAPADFLRRYLAMFDGVFGELDGPATARQALLNPMGAPAGILPWLATFVGMPIDERWPEAAKRAIIREATWLFRFRGTVRGLSRFLELYTGVAPVIVEQFRLRGLGAVGDANGPESRSILGAGFRVGGELGDETESPIAGQPAADAFQTNAHRFTVLIPARLTQEQTDVVQQILDVHRPAHTIVQVCTVDAGMRVGRGLMIGLTSMIGRTGGFSQLQTGASRIGRDAILGRPEAGTIPDASRLGVDSRVG
jgi:phage tail-like protein